MQKMMKQFKKSPKGFARRLGGMMATPMLSAASNNNGIHPAGVVQIDLIKPQTGHKHFWRIFTMAVKIRLRRVWR